MTDRNIYLITAPNNITPDEFDLFLTRRLQKVNAADPQSLFVVESNNLGKLICDRARAIGISPDRITIYHKEELENPYYCRTIKLPSTKEINEAMLFISNCDIVWRRATSDNVRANGVQFGDNDAILRSVREKRAQVRARRSAASTKELS